jgi:hypothetical protein
MNGRAMKRQEQHEQQRALLQKELELVEREGGNDRAKTSKPVSRVAAPFSPRSANFWR